MKTTIKKKDNIYTDEAERRPKEKRKRRKIGKGNIKTRKEWMDVQKRARSRDRATRFFDPTPATLHVSLAPSI